MQLLNLTKKTRDKKEYRHAFQFIFCKFLVGNSEITEAYELRNIDITEFTCLDFSNVNLKFLTLRSLKSRLQSCQNEKKCQKESMGKICLVLVSKRIDPKKYQVSKRFF